MAFQDYLDRQDKKTGNTLGGDLWRLALEAIDVMDIQCMKLKLMRAQRDQLSKLVEGIEKRWKNDLAREAKEDLEAAIAEEEAEKENDTGT